MAAPSLEAGHQSQFPRDPHAVLRNNTERSCAPFTCFLLTMGGAKSQYSLRILRYSDINTVKIQSIVIDKGTLHVTLSTLHSDLSLSHSLLNRRQ